jgi:endo-1,4-beta-mannosidase
MTEKQIQLLGFEREEYGDYEGDHHYYSYSIADGFGFISSSSDEVEDGEWYVDFFDSWPNIRFTSFEEVQSLINLIEKRVIK